MREMETSLERIDGRRPAAQRWLVAALFLGIAFGISMLFRDYIASTIFVFFFGAVAGTAYYSGLRAALIIAALGLVLTNLYLVEPYGEIHLTSARVITTSVLFLIAAFISWLTHELSKTRVALAMHADQLEAQTIELEAQMEESQSLAERAQSASRAKTDFLAVMSHELRTPLNAIVGYSDLLQTGVSGPLTETQKTQLSRIRSSSFHLLDLIQDVLSFSRIEAGREELRVADVDVGELVTDVHNYVVQDSNGKGLQVDVMLPPERLVIITDPPKLRQILLNLLTNACKFTDEGHVSLAVRALGEDVVFEVSDSGPGIAPEHLDFIFQPFTQVDQTTTRQKGGAGLGLPVSRRLAHLLGGELHVQSEVGQGSTFTVRLPIKPDFS